jgi:hypothetical protein
LTNYQQAVDRTFPVTVTNGQIAIQIITTQVSAIINAIEITQQQGTIGVSVSPPSAALSAGQSQPFSATVTGTSNTAVNWSILPAGLGGITSAGVYTAPASIANPQTVAITAASAVDLTKSATATVTLLPPVSVNVTVNPSGVVLYNGQTQQFTATVAGPANTAVTWSLGSGAVGTIGASGLYTAPALLTSPQADYITATSAADGVTSSTVVASLVPSGQITAIAPNTTRAGNVVTVSITGQNTNFTQGVTQAKFGAGITVGGASNTADGQFGPIVVTSATTATATIAVNRSAALGARDVILNTNGAQPVLTGGFTVTQPLPQVTITSPQNSIFTNVSPITVAGTSSDPAATVTVNGIQYPGSGGAFQLPVPLVEGPNTITAIATTASGLTGTASIQVTLDTTPPHVAITSPTQGYVTSAASLTVSGTVNDLVVGTVNDQQATVTVNGTAAQVANRSFSAANIALGMGLNTIQVVGLDRSGNSATATVTVQRIAPILPEVRVVSGDGQSAAISTTLAQPLVATLVNAIGIPQPNRPVVFKVMQNNGSLDGGAATVSSYQTGGNTVSVVVNTNAQGQASVQWKLGSRSGAGMNRVEASAGGFSGPAAFTATGVPATAAQIVVDSGGLQTGAVSTQLPKPFVVVVTDSGHNRLAGAPVTFTVTQGGGNIGTLTSVTQNTDSDGRALAALTLGPIAGIANNLVEATFVGNTGSPARFAATSLQSGDPTQTTISGVVLDNSNNPIQGVTIRLYKPYQGQANNVPVQVGNAVATDAQGQFSLQSVPVGQFKLFVDGGTAQRAGPWPTLEYDIWTVAGQNHTIGMPIYLPILDSVNKLCLTTDISGGTLTLPQVPGFALTVAPGSATFPGGARTGCITVTPVHMDKVPMVPGFGQQPRFVVTIQPSGTTFNPPASMTLPNVDGLKPHEVTEMYSFDHDLNTFVAIGTATTSDDGSTISGDKGVGVLKAGWHCGGNPNPTGDGQNVGVTISPNPVVLPLGASPTTLTARGAPPGGTFTWSIDSASIATLQSLGTTATVTGRAKGTTNALVAYQAGETARAQAEVIVPLVTVFSVGWTGTKAWDGFKRTSNNWSDDQLTDDGTVAVTSERLWVDEGPTSLLPLQHDPIAMGMGSKPIIKTFELHTDPPVTADAVVKISSAAAGPTQWTFPETTVHFVNGVAISTDALYSSSTLPNFMTSLDIPLIWQVSFDGGSNFTPITGLSGSPVVQRVFVILATPRAFPGGLGLAAHSVTAARIQFVLNRIASASPTDSVSLTKVVGNTVIGSFLQGAQGLSVFQNDPWVALNMPAPVQLDCFSLSAITLVQILQVGANAQVAFAYAVPKYNYPLASPPVYNTNLDATQVHTAMFPGVPNAELHFYNALGTIFNRFEAFIALFNDSGDFLEADTLFPLQRSIPLSGFAGVQAMSALPRAAFNVIYVTLQAERSPDHPFGGQLRWVYDTGNSVFTEVAPSPGAVEFPQ